MIYIISLVLIKNLNLMNNYFNYLLLYHISSAKPGNQGGIYHALIKDYNFNPLVYHFFVLLLD